MSEKRRYAFAGASGRALGMYLMPLVNEFAHNSEVVGIMDVNQTRMDYHNRQAGTQMPTYKDFGRMMDETRPDCVIVTTKDCHHHEYIIDALERGKDVIAEKPMTIDGPKCKAILDAEKKSPGTVTVTFNYRFVPYATRVKQLLESRIIGDIHSVQFQWWLDTHHGADYFRRWHGELANCGGLLVHKATHHFDLVNWWLDDEPEEVFARASLNFYGPTRKERGERCLTCKHTGTCEFFWDIRIHPGNKALYLDAEHEDGYFRDQCVFGERIDIYDTMAAQVKYKSGIVMNYSLEAYSPFEGYTIAFNGTHGRIEATEYHASPQAHPDYQTIRIYHTRKGVQDIKVGIDTSGHGGGDRRLQQMLFDRGDRPDPHGHMADSWSGAKSVLIGAAANESVKTGRPVTIAELLK